MAEYIGREDFLKRIKPYDTSDKTDKALYNFALNEMMKTPNANVIPIPEGAINGNMIISLYPNIKYTIQNGRVVTTIGIASSFDLEWWNAPYKRESEGDND